MGDKKPNCWECKYRGEVPGSAHSSCQHPATGNVRGNAMASLIGLYGKHSGLIGVPGSADAHTALGIKGHRQGIVNGWFLWPVNFDPTWLEACNGFEAKSEPVSALVD